MPKGSRQQRTRFDRKKGLKSKTPPAQKREPVRPAPVRSRRSPATKKSYFYYD